MVCAGSDEVTERSLGAIGRDFRELWQLVDGAGVQVTFTSILPVTDRDAERTREPI